MLQPCCWSGARREAERRLQHRRVLEKKTRRRLWHLEFILSYRLSYSGHGVHKYSFLLDTDVIEDRAGFLQAVRVLQRLRWTVQLASAQKRLLPQVLNRLFFPWGKVSAVGSFIILLKQLYNAAEPSWTSQEWNLLHLLRLLLATC